MTGHLEVEISGPETVASSAIPPLHTRLSKRALDIIGSCVALVVLLPAFILTAIAIYVTNPGPVIFRQVRVGAGGKPFRILKFRSMRRDAEEILHADPELHQRYLDNGHKLNVDEDLRVTRIGRFLRRSSLDEIPQFWNVLKGEMSLVGPRPVLPDELDQRYGFLRTHYITARPGLTGPWQIAGRSSVGYDQRVMLDTTYIEDWKLRRDISILARTPAAVVRRRGAH